MDPLPVARERAAEARTVPVPPMSIKPMSRKGLGRAEGLDPFCHIGSKRSFAARTLPA